MKVIAISAFVFVSSLVAIGCQPSSPVGGESQGRVSEPVDAPCAGAEIHHIESYDVCNGGHVDVRQQETWCCADGTKPVTDSLFEATGQTCAADTLATSTCSVRGPQRLEDCSNFQRETAARNCTDNGCRFDIQYGDNNTCVVTCLD